MGIPLQLDQMTTADKIRVMESLWDDLCRHAEEFASPGWHKELLMQREQNIRVGEAQFEEWGTAKKKIRDALK